MKYVIDGNIFPILTVYLDIGEEVISQTHAMISMTNKVEMKTFIYGGITKGVRRMAGGDPVFMTKFKSNDTNQSVSLSDEVCGNILPLSVSDGKSYLCDRSAYLCSEVSVDLDIAFMKDIKMGLFGGESFIMERLSGNGMVFLHGKGELHKIILGNNEKLKIATSRIMALSSSASMDVEFVKSANNVLFSGQGLFMTNVTGPGEVYLQSPVSKLK